MDQEPNTAQHYIECDTESCRNFSEFYCNTCHQRICPQCKQRHLEQNKGHDIALYEKRKRKLPLEKCNIHPTEDIDVYCDDCQDPVCFLCFFFNHSDHDKSDLETIYNDILQQCRKEITEILKKDIPEAKNNVGSIEEKRENVKKEFAKLRVSMHERADELKMAVDSVLTDNNKKLDEIENSVLNDMVKQQKETEDYIEYLEKMIADYETRVSSITHTELMKFHLDIALATMNMPNKSKSKLPTFTLGTLNEQEIAKQFGEIELDLSERFKLSSVTKVSEKTIRRAGTSHLSFLPPNKFWVSESRGNINQYDTEGNILHKISTIVLDFQGNHTVTTEGELLYTDYSKNTVCRVTSDKSLNKLIQTGSWKPGAIYSSPINGHILVGMEGNYRETKITRYNRNGRKLQDLRLKVKGKTLYQGVNYITYYNLHQINYITENINGDICTSDSSSGIVVVVTRTGENRFTYFGQKPQYRIWPRGICTDVLGHILVCNGYQTFDENYSSVHLLDINGQFLSFLLTPRQCPSLPRALCIDDQHNLWVGGSKSSTVSVYKYLQETKQ
ncbi:uncharacterized protein LOC134268181 [Saccostrea cucullata]|uniref:uncharacterized protein LOC134268181 n=1 Tax=Saccostrea cuccullata TaxID=36930 RepID=UPI002ECFD84F